MAGAMKYIRDTYGVPAKRGARILFQGKPYVILSAKNGRLRIWACPDRIPVIKTIHPTWEVDYRYGND